MLLQGAMALTGATAGVLFVRADRALRPAMMVVDDQPVEPGSAAWSALDLPAPSQPPTPVWYGARASAIHVPDLSRWPPDLDPSAIQEWDRATGRRSRSLLAVAVRDQHRNPAAVVMLLDPRPAEGGGDRTFGAEARGLVEALTWQAMRPASQVTETGPAEDAALVQDIGVTNPSEAPILIKRLMLTGIPRKDAEAIAAEVFDRSATPAPGQSAKEFLEWRKYQAIERRVGPRPKQRFRAWSEFRRSGLPLVLLIGGCSGSGKSTLAAKLGLRLGIGRIQSSDTLREVMRLLVSRSLAPEIHCSSYQAWQVLPRLPADLGAADRVVAGFCAQSDKVAIAIRGVVQRTCAEQESAIVEGTHLNPALMQEVIQPNAIMVPMLIAVPTKEGLAQHFQSRKVQAPTRADLRHLDHFDDIWELQRHLVTEAAASGVSVIPNLGMKFCIQQVLDLIAAALLDRFPPP
jgi:2-phosphoglycerate kinase